MIFGVIRHGEDRHHPIEGFAAATKTMTYVQKSDLDAVTPPPLEASVPFSFTLALDTAFFIESLGSLHHHLAWNYADLNASVYASVDGVVPTSTGRSPGITDFASAQFIAATPTVMTAQTLLKPAPALAVP